MEKGFAGGKGEKKKHILPQGFAVTGHDLKPLKLLLVSASTILQKFEQPMEFGGRGGGESFFLLCLPLLVQPWPCHLDFLCLPYWLKIS